MFGPPTAYPCLVKLVATTGDPCSNTASYFAIDNRAPHAHICRWCWHQLSPSDRALYQEESYVR